MMYYKPFTGLLAATLLSMSSFGLQAADYVIDTKGAHAFIQFKISHLGYSWVVGRFDKFTGKFSYDEKDPSASKVSVDVDVSSVDTNHVERDNHLRGEHFLDVEKYPDAKFVSSSYKDLGNGKGELKGNLTLHGVTKPLTIEVTQVGHGPDPWGGYRRGFQGTTHFALADYGIDYNLGPTAKEVELYLSVEGIRQ